MRQTGEDMRIGVSVELLADLFGQHLDLLNEAAQRGHQRSSDRDLRGAGGCGQATRGGAEAGKHDC